MDVYIIGGGPSLIGFDWNRLTNKLTLGCNDAYQLGPAICKACVFGDLKWFAYHDEELAKFPNPRFTNEPSLYVHSPDWLLCMRREGNGLHQNALGWNGNTGAVAINLALVLGAQRVFLLGYDMKAPSKNLVNWHVHNVSKPNMNSYERFKRGMESVKNNLPSVFPGREIINIGPDSDLDCFPKEPIDKFL
jgi:hypothetical protein